MQMKVDNEKEVHDVTAFKKALDEENDSDEEDAEEEDDFVDELEVQKQLQGKIVNGKLAPRSSVTAEVYGHYNQKQNLKPRVIMKSMEDKQTIRKTVENCLMFKNLEEKEKKIVIDAFEEKKVVGGATVIMQGDDGSEM